MTVQKGNKVRVEYEGTFDDGTVFDSSKHSGQPLEFEAGAGQVIKGFDEAVMDMSEGEEKKIHIPAAEAYGEYRGDYVKEVPREQLPAQPEPKEGMMLAVRLPNGAQMPVKITKVNPKTVTVDFNHPLAGKDLNFKIKVVAIIT